MRPPPLQLLPAFEASARLLSFSKAAVELHVTPAAISQQMRQLEAYLGFPLFQRLTRRVELTDAGRQFAEVVTQTLATYRRGHAELMDRFIKPSLRLAMTPQVAHRYVLPRLSEFQAQHPGVSISLDASMGLADFEEEPLDAAIRVGARPWPGLEAWFICDCDAVVMATPELAARHPVNQLEDLRHHTLIHRRNPQFGWEALAQLAGIPRIPSAGDLVVDSDLAALHAAEQGLGVALSIMPSGSPAQGDASPVRLVPALAPFKTPLKVYFVFRPHSGKDDLLRATFEWLRASVVAGGAADT
ncbi:LysR substrate-binding domain-containing protein [Zavarzinia compransoris]|uniref:LysR substrate-binding domain-containing protein n=1 Tax=Zavarzinia marina TaxID=2911065 RepID=UPI001F3EFF8C|nr:LysR substrate-binding domain-containing protein [Zavarzinia marina]MCF4167411.1 LysR substrate-binding domain-containing protein [Zavarzinia marina]